MGPPTPAEMGDAPDTAAVHAGVSSIAEEPLLRPTVNFSRVTDDVPLTRSVRATTPPVGRSVDWVSLTPESAVCLLFSEANMPTERMVKANTEATTTKAIRMIAVSRPVMPRSERSKVPLPTMHNIGAALCLETSGTIEVN